jgi:hypothetical protein
MISEALIGLQLLIADGSKYSDVSVAYSSDHGASCDALQPPAPPPDFIGRFQYDIGNAAHDVPVDLTPDRLESWWAHDSLSDMCLDTIAYGASDTSAAPGFLAPGIADEDGDSPIAIISYGDGDEGNAGFFFSAGGEGTFEHDGPSCTAVGKFDDTTIAENVARAADRIGAAYDAHIMEYDFQMRQHTCSIAKVFVYAWEFRLRAASVRAAFIMWLNFLRDRSSTNIAQVCPCVMEHEVSSPDLPLLQVAHCFHISHLVIKAFGFWIVFLARVSQTRFWAESLHVGRLLVVAFRTWHGAWSMSRRPPPPPPVMPIWNASSSEHVDYVSDSLCSLTYFHDHIEASFAGRSSSSVQDIPVPARRSICVQDTPWSSSISGTPNWEAWACSVSAGAAQMESDRISYERVMADPKLRAKFYRMQSKKHF